MSTNKKDPEKFVYKSFPIDEKYLLTGEEKAKEKARLKAMVTSEDKKITNTWFKIDHRTGVIKPLGYSGTDTSTSSSKID